MRHRAEDLRHALPESNAILADLREQAMPVVEAAREQAERVRGRRRGRGRKPLLIVAVLALGAIAAYFFISRRDNQPAYLMPTPEEPLTPPSAEGPDHGDPEPPSPSESEQRSSQESGYREPAVAPTGNWASTPASDGSSSTTGQTPGAQPSNGSYGGGFQPRAQAAAWDLPSSSQGNSLR